MASHKSAIKRAKQNKKRRMRNAAVKSTAKTLVKNVLSAVAAKDATSAGTAFAKAVPVIAKAAAKGVFHKKTASRKISRLARKVNALS